MDYNALSKHWGGRQSINSVEILFNIYFLDVKHLQPSSWNLPLETENTAWKYMNDTKEVLITGEFYVDRGKPDAMLGKSKIKKWTWTDWIFIPFIQ